MYIKYNIKFRELYDHVLLLLFQMLMAANKEGKGYRSQQPNVVKKF